MKTIIFSSPLGLSLLAGFATAQTIYRSVDDEMGKISYSDRPKFADEAMELKLKHTSSAEVTKRVTANQEAIRRRVRGSQIGSGGAGDANRGSRESSR